MKRAQASKQSGRRTGKPDSDFDEDKSVRASSGDEEMDEGYDDDDRNDDNDNGFRSQRMPEQHPAIRTTLQLMGVLISTALQF